MNVVKVSIIIPAYNVQDYIVDCLESIMNQTLKDFEVIIVDDQSMDCTLQICREYELNYNNVIVLSQKHRGQGAARNLGLSVAKGEYIGFVDADDYVEYDMFEKMYRQAKAYNADITICDIKKFFVSENKLVPRKSFESSSELISVREYINQGWNITYSWNKLYKKNVWEDVFFENIAFEDVALIPKILSMYEKVAYVQEPLYVYCKRQGATTTTIGNVKFLDVLKAYDRVLYSESKLKSDLIFFVAKCLLNNLVQCISSYFRAEFLDYIESRYEIFASNRRIHEDEEVSIILDSSFLQHIQPTIFVNSEDVGSEVCDNIMKLHPMVRLQIIHVEEFKRKEDNKELLTLKKVYEHGGVIIYGQVSFKLPIGAFRACKGFVFIKEDGNGGYIPIMGFAKESEILHKYFDLVENGYTLGFMEYIYSQKEMIKIYHEDQYEKYVTIL